MAYLFQTGISFPGEIFAESQRNPMEGRGGDLKNGLSMKKVKNWQQSLHENRYGILLMLAAAVLIAVGQLCWKLSQGGFNAQLLGGFLLYGFGALLMIAALRFGKLSVVHPLLCVSYIAGLFLSHFFLHEELTVYRYVGVAIIMAGVILIGTGDRE